MTMTTKPTVGVIFGSRSVEHDVSIVTAQQVMRAIDPAKYEIIPIYITRDGRWFTGDALRDIKTFQLDDISQASRVQETHLSSSTGYPGLITRPTSGWFRASKFTKLDVAFPTVHGSHGEDGTLQGVFEMANLAYVGTGVMASAVANNKVLTKAVLRQYDIPVVDGVAFTRHQWLQDADRERILTDVDALGYPVFVKPADLGSSIGIARVDGRDRAQLHIDIAANFSRQILVEKGIAGGIEINCAVLGNHEIEASVLEQPMSAEEFLTYDEKYMRGDKGGIKEAGMSGADRIIPAPIADELTTQIQDAARRAFVAIGGQGTARIDFLAKPDDGQFWLNEINTLPGSLAFYLWEESGKAPHALCDDLIRLARERHEEKRRTTFNYKNPLIDHVSRKGLSGVKK